MKPLKLEGVLPPITTPFRNDEVNINALRHNLEKYNKTRLAGYLVLGSNGEGVFLNEAEKISVLKAARDVIPEEKIFMAGMGQESTRETVRWVNLAAKIGADCALIVTPNYYKGMMRYEPLKRHYLTVADGAEIPILIYNVPQFTGINLDAGFVESVASHPNIVGIKDSSGNIGQLAEIVRSTPDDFAVFVGSAPVFYPALCMGAAGGILAVANLIPDVCVALKDKFDAGDFAGARDLQNAIAPLSRWVTSKLGIGGLKMAMDMMGYGGGLPRSPLFQPDEAERVTLEALLAPFFH